MPLSYPASTSLTAVFFHVLLLLLQLLDKRLLAAEAGSSQALGALDSQLAEVEDVLSYVSDLLSLGEHCRAAVAASTSTMAELHYMPADQRLCTCMLHNRRPCTNL
jgi:hypothetical protein